MKAKKFSLPALKPRNPFSMLARKRAAGKHRGRPAADQRQARDEVEQWLHDMRSAGM
jgi:hypothetical protein